MTQRLHTFIPVHEVLQKAGRFHESAAALFAHWAKQASNAQTRAFLQLAAEQEETVADSLARALNGDVDLASADTFYQNPPETIPNGDDVAALEGQLQDVEAFAASLHTVHQRWIEVYQALEASNPVDRVDELLRSCRELVERMGRHLSSAQVQLKDA